MPHAPESFVGSERTCRTQEMPVCAHSHTVCSMGCTPRTRAALPALGTTVFLLLPVMPPFSLMPRGL